MTRFARRNGLNEAGKVETKKKEEATEWNQMINDADAATKSTNDPNHHDDEDDVERKKRKHELDYDKRIELENSAKRFNNPNSKEDDYDMLLSKYSQVIDKEVVQDLIDMRRSGRIGHEELLDKLMREERSNRRRLTRIEERSSSRVCFKCRKAGHAIQDCPLMSADSEQGTGICFKCGSTEHTINRCKLKLEPGHFPYAKCFICNEMGHLTKQCPDNPRGLYPNGGSCKFCSSVEHYARDCPENQKKSKYL